MRWIPHACESHPPTSPKWGLRVCVAVLQPMEIYVDDEAKLTLHGLVQHYIMLNEEGKNRKLNELLDTLEFNQVCGTHSSTRALCILHVAHNTVNGIA